MAEKSTFDYVNEVWGIASYIRDVIRPADYNKLILPFAVLRRFKCALEPTRPFVNKQIVKSAWDDGNPKHCALSGHCFHNVTGFTLANRLINETDTKGRGYSFEALRARTPYRRQNPDRIIAGNWLTVGARIDALGPLFATKPDSEDEVVDKFIDLHSGVKIDTETGEVL